ncbi:MAG TPA: type II CAAX endopeptidase family protein [Acidobacteriaceae bacterium]|nr:type II CAAX endopeptidase family protein [Acidobacteriaceae bacterium]
MAQHWISGGIALVLALVPFFAFGFAGEFCRRWANSLPVAARLSTPAVLVAPYLVVAAAGHHLVAEWIAVYLFGPVLISVLLYAAARLDLRQRGHALDFLVLFPLGLAVDLRWLEPAWPTGLSVIGKLVLLDAGLYGFLAVRQLTGVGFDLRLRGRDWWVGLREFVLYAPVAIALGLAIGFLHLHGRLSRPAWEFAPAWVFTFIAIALPEEIFFRGWMQNLLERRIGRRSALLLTAGLFGLSHFNKRAAHFNWRYVLLAAIAGVFYGRAWRSDRRIGASAITHATVDTVWGALLR